MPRRSNRQVAVDDDVVMSASQADDDNAMLTFTQQGEPEKSQSFPAPKANERTNLEGLSEAKRQQVIVDMSRLVLFKALAGEPIDRLKCFKSIQSMPANTRITSAVWQEVQTNLQNVFGFDLVKAPQYMADKLPKKYEDRYFCKNAIMEDEAGAHSKAIHSVHPDNSIEKGLLMVVLAFMFCKGTPRPGFPPTMRWITDVDLYKLLHGLDENLPQDPPSVNARKVHSSQSNTVIDGATPKLDLLMEKFCVMDYLLKDKMESDVADKDVIVYSMGPRAALEVGRRQIIYFCSEILEEQPDPTMLQELEDDGETQATQ